MLFAVAIVSFTDGSRRQSSKQPGQWSRSRAQRLRYDWARRHWPVLFVMCGLYVALGVAVLLVPVPHRQFISGSFFVSGPWTLIYFVERFSGAASAAMGETAEHWTATELCLLGRRGWEVAHGVRLGRRGDIDHVALGPGGLLVVETKWSGAGWEERISAEVIERAVAQVRHNAREVRLTLPRVGPVSAVVVLWGHPQPSEPIEHPSGVTVVGGDSVADWLTTYAGGAGVTDPAEVEAGWKKLLDQTRRRDAFERGRQPAEPTLERTIKELAVGGIGGLLGAILVLGAIGPWYLALSVPLAAGLWLLRNRTRFRRVLAAAAVAVAGLTLELLLVIAALTIDHRFG